MFQSYHIPTALNEELMYLQLDNIAIDHLPYFTDMETKTQKHSFSGGLTNVRIRAMRKFELSPLVLEF